MDSETDESEEFYEPDDLQEMHEAIINDELDRFKEICSQDIDFDGKFAGDVSPEHYGMTPLGLSAALGRLDHVKVLLDNGANVNASFANLKTTALMTASFHGHVEIVDLLLEEGANPQAVDLQRSNALGYCFGGSRSIDVISLLLRCGVGVNQKNMLGMDALLLVVGYGNDLLTKMVLQYGANSNSVNDFGHTALHLAVVGKRSLISKATRGRGMTSVYGLNRRNLDRSIINWAHEHSEYLTDGKINEIHLENVAQFMSAIGKLINEPENFIYNDDQEDMMKRLNAVAEYHKEKFHASISLKKPTVIDTLLSCGGRRSRKAKSQANSGSLPQDKPKGLEHLASPEVNSDVTALSNRYVRIIKFILESRCDVHKMESTYGLTALDMAILMGDAESTVMLLAAGCDPDHLLKLCSMATLHKAITARDKKIVKDLIDNDPYLDVNGSFEPFRIAMTSVDDDDCKEDRGLTPLAIAAKALDSSTVDIIKMLVKKGADINGIGSSGRSPLGEACRWGNKKMVEFLLYHGAKLEAQNPADNDATAVSIAAMCKQTVIVEYLISKGAMVDRPMKDRRTSLIKALDADDMPMIDTLLEMPNLQTNFCDRNGFFYSMAEKYKQPNRDIESILHEIREHSRELEEYDERTRPKTLSNLTSRDSLSGHEMNSNVQQNDTELDEAEYSSNNSYLATQRSKSRDSPESGSEIIMQSLIQSKHQPQMTKGSKKSTDGSEVKTKPKKTKKKKTIRKETDINLPPLPPIANVTDVGVGEEEETEKDDSREAQPKLQHTPAASPVLVAKKTKPKKQKKIATSAQLEEINISARRKKRSENKKETKTEIKRENDSDAVKISTAKLSKINIHKHTEQNLLQEFENINKENEDIDLEENDDNDVDEDDDEMDEDTNNNKRSKPRTHSENVRDNSITY